MTSKFYTHFQIGTCNHPGCINNNADKTCWLDGLELKNYVKHAENIHNSRICTARKQANLYLTESMLYEK